MRLVVSLPIGKKDTVITTSSQPWHLRSWNAPDSRLQLTSRLIKFVKLEIVDGMVPKEFDEWVSVHNASCSSTNAHGGANQ